MAVRSDALVRLGTSIEDAKPIAVEIGAQLAAQLMLALPEDEPLKELLHAQTSHCQRTVSVIS